MLFRSHHHPQPLYIQTPDQPHQRPLCYHPFPALHHLIIQSRPSIIPSHKTIPSWHYTISAICDHSIIPSQHCTISAFYHLSTMPPLHDTLGISALRASQAQIMLSFVTLSPKLSFVTLSTKSLCIVLHQARRKQT